jgi:hypothetical protein
MHINEKNLKNELHVTVSKTITNIAIKRKTLPGTERGPFGPQPYTIPNELLQRPVGCFLLPEIQCNSEESEK